MNKNSNLNRNKSIRIYSIAMTLIVGFSSLSEAANETSSKCPGETGYNYVNNRRRNPTDGGFVSNKAYVEDGDSIFIAKTAAICGSSKVTESAKIFGTATIRDASVFGHAEVFGDARIEDGAEVTDNAKVSENAVVRGSVRVFGNAVIAGDAKVQNFSQDSLAQVFDSARVSGNARVQENAQVSGQSRIMGHAIIFGTAAVTGNAVVTGFTKLNSGVMSSGSRNDPDYDAIEAAKAKAERDRLDREAAVEAEKARIKKEKEDADLVLANKRKAYNEIIKDIPNWLGANRSNSFTVTEVEFCRLKFQFSYKSEPQVVIRGDIYFTEDPKFSLDRSAGQGDIQIWINLFDNWHTSPADLSLMYKSDPQHTEPIRLNNGKVQDALGSLAFPISFGNESAGAAVAKFEKLLTICHELKK
jgi:carbonic anhydrase/acetyltransferase-like protein (isoleucine patch superfamily)